MADKSLLSGKNIIFSAGYPQFLNDSEVVYMSDSRTTSLGLRARCDRNGGPIYGDVDYSPEEEGGPLWRLDGNTRVIYSLMIQALIDSNSQGVSRHAGGTKLFQAINQLNSQYPN